MLFELIYFFILIFSLKYNSQSSIIGAASGMSPILGRILSLMYTAAFIWFAGIGTARFELFISTDNHNFILFETIKHIVNLLAKYLHLLASVYYYTPKMIFRQSLRQLLLLIFASICKYFEVGMGGFN